MPSCKRRYSLCHLQGMSLRHHDAACQNDGHLPLSRENSHTWEGSFYPPPTPYPRQRGEAQFPNPHLASAHPSKQRSQEVLGHSRLGRDPSVDPNVRFSERGTGVGAHGSFGGGWQDAPNRPLFRWPSDPLQALPPRFSQPPSPSLNHHDFRQGANSDSCRELPRAPQRYSGGPPVYTADGFGPYRPQVSGSDGFRRESEDRTGRRGLSPNPLSRTYTGHCPLVVPPGLTDNLAATYPPNSAPLTPYESLSRARDRFVRPLHRFPDLMPLGGVGSQLQEPPLTNPSVRTVDQQAANQNQTPGAGLEWPGGAEMDSPRGDLPALYPLYNQREAPFYTGMQENPQGRGVKTFSSASGARAGPSLIGVLRAYYGTRAEHEISPPEGARKLAATYPGVLPPRDSKSPPDASPKGTIDSSQSPSLTERRASVPGNMSGLLSRSGGASSHIALRPPSTPRLTPSPRTRSLLLSSTAGDSQNEGATGRNSGGADGAENRSGEGVGRFQEKGEESKGSSVGGPRKERDRERFQRADAENERER